MRTKLFLLLILSSLSSLAYAQKLSQQDFQGLWYIINDRKSFDSIYNIRYDSIIFVDDFRNNLEKVPPVKKRLNSDSGGVPNSLLEEISVLTGGFGALYGNQEELEVFEVKNNVATFYTNVYSSSLIYTWEDKKILGVKFGQDFTRKNSDSLFSTEYKIDKDFLSFKINSLDKWTDNQILYYKNDTLILRNPTRNEYSVYVRKRIDTKINYKINKVTISKNNYKTEVNDDGKIFFTFKNNKYQKRPYKIEDGNYSSEISKETFDELLYIMKYKNIKIGEKKFFSSLMHDTPYKIIFNLESGENIEYKLYEKIGPPELRILEGKIYSLMAKISKEK